MRRDINKSIDRPRKAVVKSAAREPMKKLLLLGLLVSTACGGDEKSSLFTPKPECKGDAITPYQGTFPQVISQLSIGTVQDGFDLNGDK
jgi:hypothetical protein